MFRQIHTRRGRVRRSASAGPGPRIAPAIVRYAMRAAVLAAGLAVIPPTAQAQVRPDSAVRADSAARRIEGVTVQAIRAGSDTPIAQKTIERAALTQRHFGQDVPMLLMNAAPSLMAHTETGTQWGYSYLRLRGLDQTRINITIDGVPLNDMEDQVLYFANFADLLSNVQSVQVQRGVGTSTAGTASYAGSINFETVPVAQRQAGGDVQLQMGSFGAQRATASFNTGLTDRRFAAYGRVSALRTNGYRDHSGVMGRSAFLGAGWFGDKDIVKLTALVGLLADTLSYTGATLEQLARNRRFNPLSPDERDKFGQQMVSLAWSRALSGGGTVNTTVYRNSASGNYDYFELPDRYRFNLAHTWYGATSVYNVERGAVRLHTGMNANTYQRAHRGYLQPDVALYDNTGHKQDASAFAKLSLDAGKVRWFADVQGRWARFRYAPSANAGISERHIDWAFLNPKAGVTYTIGHGVSAFASYGITSREPARNDLFGGEDDLNSGNVADFGDFTRVKPERLGDTEIGLNVTKALLDFSANLYSMDFRNDIARIGAPTASGSILRRNVGSSYRRGLEVDVAYRGIRRVVLAGNATWSTNRIAQFTDSSRGTPVVRRNVEPLLTPRFVSAHRVEVMPTARVMVGLEGRYQSRAFLDNTSSPDRVLPDYYTLDATARVTLGRTSFVLRGQNLGETQKFGSGAVSGSGRVRYFVLPARALFVTAAYTW
ncbi:MAG: TonB-dependent receptor [Gemmatimonas sp.]|jgi:iron complex outermembrane receptor protein|uniref:TonB-dependent receptor n=1 Tax=Gemmatimonas sp. TaxID=1962908 RepID=UPI00391F0D68|nr:TonB-dependent receptor [Gemmatimonadota bacterium]